MTANELALIAIVFLYVVGWALPTLGLILLAIGAGRAFREAEPRAQAADGTPKIAFRQADGSMGYASIGALSNAAEDAARAPVIARRQVVRDIGLVGLGLASATAASIWSLFI